jgi:hypothetical protein
MISIAKTFPEVFSAAKFTTIYREEQFCPVGDHDCACRRLSGEYLICTDPKVLTQPNTDTGKICCAGVRQMYWCIAKPEGYPEMVREFSEHYLDGNPPLLAEGNTVLPFLKPRLRLFMVNPCLPFSWWKGNTRGLLETSDFIIINSYPGASSNSVEEPQEAIISALSAFEQKQILMENPERLDRWKDQRLFQVISALADTQVN